MNINHDDEVNGVEANQSYLSRKKLSHILKAARSATAANILAPLLCIPMFGSEVRELNFLIWLGYMFVSVLARTLIIYGLEHKAENIKDPSRDLKKTAFAVGIVGFGWGLGWPLMAPDLELVNRMIYVYMTTAAMISSMFAYSVDRRTFYSFTLPIMIPAVSTILWPMNIFPWPFLVGLTALYFVVLSIAKNFSHIFAESVELRFGNEQLYRELANERDLSIAANVAKSKFIAAASHDLRQPLHAVNINLELFRPPGLREKDANLLRRIKGSIMALNGMFEALLNMSKLDSHSTKVEHQNFLLVDLSDSIREIVESSAMGKGLSFVVSAPALKVYGDKLLLQQLLINLVMNAIQYTQTGDVELRFSDVAGHLVVEVADTGVGIPLADQKNIFNEFFRSENTRKVHDGLGLGLSIVKRVCKLLNASIRVESEVGKGSTFTVSTSFPVLGAVADLAAPDDLVWGREKEYLQGLENKCIAIIEDDGVIADAYKETLLAHGAVIVALSEHDDELQMQLESVNRIDCILSDYHLSQTTGDIVIEKIRENYNSDIPAVIVTGDTSPKTMDIFEKVDAVILYKPLTLQKIAETIKYAIDSRP